MDEAGDCFLNSSVLQFEPALLAIARFYRNTYRPVKSCESFKDAIFRSNNSRQVLRQSYLYGEAVSQLYYAGYPHALIQPHLSEALRLLERALVAGFRTVRHIVALAFLSAVENGSRSGEAVLRALRSDDKSDWRQAIRWAAEADPWDASANLLVDGGDSSTAITRLGTFVNDILTESELAGVLHNFAVALDGTDPVALTNLARHLVKHGDRDDLTEATRRINQASAFSDRGFKWWRSVLADIKSRHAVERNDRPGHSRPSKKAMHVRRVGVKFPIVSVDDYGSILDAARLTKSRAQKESYLDMLVFSLASLSVGMEPLSEILLEPRPKIARIRHRETAYVVRCRWHDKKLGFAELDSVAHSVPQDHSLLMLSMSGFSQEALEKVGRGQDRRWVLMDAIDLADLIEVRISFDELIAVKRHCLEISGEPCARARLSSEL